MESRGPPMPAAATAPCRLCLSEGGRVDSSEQEYADQRGYEGDCCT